MVTKRNFAMLAYLTVIIVDRSSNVLTTCSLFPIVESDLIKEIFNKFKIRCWSCVTFYMTSENKIYDLVEETISNVR